MSTQVIGSGPVGFTNSDGNQVFIPLSSLYFDAGGQIKADKWSFYTVKNKNTVDVLLKELVEGSFLLPGIESSTKPAMLIEAVISGAVGNHILRKLKLMS